MKIFRGFKHRQYEFYRIAAWHVYEMAQLIRPNDAKKFHPNRTQPPWEELELTSEQRQKLDTYRQMKISKDYEDNFEKKK